MKKLTVTILVGGEKAETLTDEQLKTIAKRIGRAMSSHYTNNPEEYKKIESEKNYGVQFQHRSKGKG
jgi:hypothetical protein